MKPRIPESSNIPESLRLYGMWRILSEGKRIKVERTSPFAGCSGCSGCGGGGCCRCGCPGAITMLPSRIPSKHNDKANTA